MTESPLTLADIATFAAIAGAVVSILGTGLKVLVEYLTRRFGSDMTVRQQSENCRFDHEKLSNILASQNANIAKMLEQNGKQIDALSEASHAAELRHQIVLAKLERIEDHIKPKYHE